MCSEVAPNTLCCFSHSQVHRSKNQGAELGMASVTTTPSDLLAKTLLPDLVTLCSASLEVLVPKGGVSLPGDAAMIP